MFLFGHLGIGSELVRPFSRGLSLRWILFGALFPDLIDKTLYYSLKFASGKTGAEIFIIHGTRSIGHTGVLTLFLAFLALRLRSKPLAALCLGSLSHLLLDALSFYIPHYHFDDPQLGDLFTALPLLWPLRGWDFPITPYASFTDQLTQMKNPYTFSFECVGFITLLFRTGLLKNRFITLRRK